MQTAKFLKLNRNHRLYAAFHLVALRGLRRAETAALRWAGIDLQHGVLLVTHTTQRDAGRLMQCPPKTNTSRRTAVLDRTTVKELRRHYARQQTEAARLRIDPSGFVFTNRRGDNRSIPTTSTANSSAPPARRACARSGCTT